MRAKGKTAWGKMSKSHRPTRRLGDAQPEKEEGKGGVHGDTARREKVTCCDLTGVVIEFEQQGKYTFDRGASQLHMSVTGYLNFEKLSDEASEFKANFEKLPAAAKMKGAWEFAPPPHVKGEMKEPTEAGKAAGKVEWLRLSSRTKAAGANRNRVKAGWSKVKKKALYVSCDITGLLIDPEEEGRYTYEGANAEPKAAMEPAAGDDDSDFDVSCDLTGVRIECEKQGRYSFGGVDDGLDMSVEAYQTFTSLAESAESKLQWGELPEAAKTRENWIFVPPPFQGEIRMCASAFGHFGALAGDFPGIWKAFPREAKVPEAWKYVPSPKELHLEEEVQQQSHQDEAEEEEDKEEDTEEESDEEIEYKCIATGAAINFQADGRYVHNNPADPWTLDMCVGAFKNFGLLPTLHAERWHTFPDPAKEKTAWKYVAPEEEKVSRSATGESTVQDSETGKEEAIDEVKPHRARAREEGEEQIDDDGGGGQAIDDDDDEDDDDDDGVRSESQWESGVSYPSLRDVPHGVLQAMNLQEKTVAWEDLWYHLSKVSSTNLRNTGTVLGNLMACGSKRFPSDIATPFFALDVVVTLASGESMLLEELLQGTWLKRHPGTVVASLFLPFCLPNTFFRVFKVMKRPQNCISDVNAAFKFITGDSPSAVCIFGGSGIGLDEETLFPVRAHKMEAMVLDYIAKYQKETGSEDYVQWANEKSKHDLLTWATAIATYDSAIPIVPDESSEYRATLCGSLTFKAVTGFLAHLGHHMEDGVRNRTDHTDDIRRARDLPSPSVTDMDFAEMIPAPSVHPKGVGKPVVKITAPLQAGGEIKYVDDIDAHGSLHAYYVQSTIAKGRVLEVDVSLAERAVGFVSYLDAGDIPGDNNHHTLEATHEPLLVDIAPCPGGGQVTFWGQPIGIVVADTLEHAKAAALLVRIGYHQEEAILTIEQAIEAKSYLTEPAFWQQREKGCLAPFGGTHYSDLYLMEPINTGDAQAVIDDDPDSMNVILIGRNHQSIRGSVHTPAQSHLYMETQSAFAIPRPNEFGVGDGVEVWHSSQNLSQAGQVVAQVLGVKQHMVEVKMTQSGGAFGGKLTRGHHVAAAASLAAVKLRRPVRMTLELPQDMVLTGGRELARHDYEARIDSDTGEVLALF